MILFHNDYSEGCHESVMDALITTNLEQTPGYGEDCYCATAAEKIKKCCGREDVDVHFLVGGTQANLVVITAALRPHQGVLCADSGHVNVHETGAIEATGHRVIGLPSWEGKITGKQVTEYVRAHYAAPSFEHTVQPGMVYISNPTEWGTLYSKAELEELSVVCKAEGLYLFVDGARLGYGLTSGENSLTMADLAELCDVFYIGGTKVGALFGEAVVISNRMLARDFRYVMKQRGAMLAKGRLLGVQFDALFTDNLYFRISSHANEMANHLKKAFRDCGYPFFVPPQTNQLFPILPAAVRRELAGKYTFIEMDRLDEDLCVCRFCTSWATKEENVRVLCEDLKRLSKS